MVFVEGDDYRALRRPGDDPAQFRSVVRPAQVPVAPDSVVHQYRGENFTTSAWVDTAPSGPQADMSINGVSATTLNGARAASSDGVDDFGKANGPQDLPENETFGIAFVVKSSDKSDLSNFMAVRESNGTFEIVDANAFDGSNGQPALDLKDSNNNRLFVEATVDVCDSQAHLVIINKKGDGAGDIDFFIDNTANTVSDNIEINDPFDSSDYNVTTQLAFFAGENEGSVDGFKALDIPFIEFNGQPYSQQDRLDLKQRAPGV
jgi:hypothetical protein